MTQQSKTGSVKEHASKQRRLTRILAIAIGLVVLAFLGICLIIGAGVHSVSSQALREYPGDKVEALMSLIESEQHSIRDRNRAIWALGQLGDSRALATLQKYYTGQEPDETKGLSQYELKKAIALCRGATNIGAFVWRRGSWGTK